jgi:hypothetical protein
MDFIQKNIKENCKVYVGILVLVVLVLIVLYFGSTSGYSLSDGNTSISPQLLKALQEGYVPANEELQQKQNTLAPANQVPPPEDIMDVSDDIPPETPLESVPNIKTAQAKVLNPNTIALPEQAPVEWRKLDAIDLKKCKINRNGNGSIFHINCVNRDTGEPSALCGDIPFDPQTMSEPPLRGPNNDRTKMEVYMKSNKCDAKWDINNVVDKGCIPGKLGRRVEIQCRLPSTEDGKVGIGVHGCPNLKRQPINGMDMLTTPIQAVNRDSSWSSAIVNDQSCTPKWDVTKRVDKGCQAQAPGKVFHIPCTIADGTLSVGCKNMQRQSIDGSDMLLNPIRNPEGNNAYTQVVISDDACKLKWDFGNMKKLQCRKNKPGMVYETSCVRSDGSKALGCDDIMQEMEINGRKQLVKATRSVDDAAVSRIVLDEQNCAPQWNWSKRQKNGCVKGGLQSWTIPCTNGLGQSSAGCLDKINKGIFRQRIKQDGLDFVDAKRRNLKEMDVFTKSKLCEPRWIDAEKRATVGCKYGGKAYTLPCRNFEGKFNDKCPDMVKTKGMIADPKRITPYRSEIYLKDKECEIETKYFIDSAPNSRRDPRWEMPKKVEKDYRNLRLQQFKQKMASRSIS